MTKTLDKKEEDWLVHGFPVGLQNSSSQPCVETNEGALRYRSKNSKQVINNISWD